MCCATILGPRISWIFFFFSSGSWDEMPYAKESKGLNSVSKSSITMWILIKSNWRNSTLSGLVMNRQNKKDPE